MPIDIITERTMRLGAALQRSLLKHADVHAALTEAMKRDDPLRLVSALSDLFPPGAVNAVAAAVMKNIETGLRQFIDKALEQTERESETNHESTH